MSSKDSEVPQWSGDATEFETFAIACRWYEKSVKDSERKQCASRVWAKLTGPAKAVVRHLNPDEFETTDGLAKLVEILRTSPLQQLPVPDLFKRLDGWHHLRRGNAETIPQLLVREEDMFTQLQGALSRARLDRTSQPEVSRSPEAVTPAATPSQSPTAGVHARSTQIGAPQQAPRVLVSESQPAGVVKDFFEDELRGYRLLKSARLSGQERQNVLTQTSNSTSFALIRRALRSLYADDEDGNWQRKPRVWWNEYGDWDQDDMTWDEYDPGNAAWFAEGDYESTAWEYDEYEESYDYDWTEDDPVPDNASNEPSEQQFREAFALATEANRTLTEAREAVRLARQSRGYFAPESNTGKGMSPYGSPSRSASHGKGKGKSSKSSSKGSSGKGFGPCFICGQYGHGYTQCPDRHSKGKGKMKSKGKAKGKGFSKSSQHYVQFHDLSSWQSPVDILMANVDRGNRVIVDSGASENAVGMESLQKLVDESGVNYKIEINDRPVFKFGNGQHLQALSRADLLNTSLGPISFYVLGGEALNTPPLMGGKTLRQLGAMLAYEENLFIYKRQDPQSSKTQPLWVAVKMMSHPSHHVSIDVMEDAQRMTSRHTWFNDVELHDPQVPVQDAVQGSDQVHEVFMLHRLTAARPASDLSSLAQRLATLRAQLQDGSTTMCGRRPTDDRLPMRRPAQAEDGPKPAWSVDQVHSMWPSPDLPVEEGSRRTEPPHGPPSKLDPSGFGGNSEDNGSPECDRASGEWQADGVERLAAAAWSDRSPGHQHEVPRLPGANGSADPEVQEQGLSIDTSISGQEDLGADLAGGHGNLCEGAWIGPVGSSRIGEDGEGSCHQGRSKGESRAKDASQEGIHSHIQSVPEQCDSDDHFGRRGCVDSGGSNQASTMSSLWSSLTRLRQRIAGQTLKSGNNDLMCDQHGHVLPSKDSAIQYQGSSPHDNHLHDEHKGNDSTCPSLNSIEAELPKPGPGGGKRHGVPPITAKKLATNVAILGAMMMTPMRSVLHQLHGSLDFLEVACSQTSSLSTLMMEHGYNIQRINVKEGFDLEKKSGTRALDEVIKTRRPRHTWVSLPCTRLTGLCNLTQRDEWEEAAFQKRRGRDLKRAEEVAESSEAILASGDDLSWEWPTTAKAGWNSRAIKKLCKLAEKYQRKIYWCHFHGCAYGLQYNNFAVQKSWTVATTDRNVWLALQRKCPGDHEHLHCRGTVAQASAYYPAKMVQAVCKAIRATWNQVDEKAGTSLSKDLGHYLLDANDIIEETYGIQGCPQEIMDLNYYKNEQIARREDPTILALTRNRMPIEMPKGKALENIKAQMLRVHKASGHTSWANLQRLLRARGAPAWAVALAGQMTCPSCSEAKRPVSASVASLQETPGLFEIVGADIFEYESAKSKYKFMLMRDRASGLIQTELLQQYGGQDQPSAWEPTSDVVIRMFGRWMMNNPAPKWILTDSATYFTSQSMMDFCMESGIGLLTTPAEAHEMLGAEEGAINILKRTVEKLLNDNEELSVELAFHLAAHGHNQTIGPSGYSPFQWARGSSAPMENIPIGINPKKAFAGMMKLKEKARVAFEVESAKARLSKLNNTTPKQILTLKPGQLVMLWRQKSKPGKTTGRWVGPVRFLLQEGQTYWLATGATLIRARASQIRACNSREELTSTLEGTAILKMPVTLDTLLRGFTGRHFSDVTGEVPSQAQRQADIQGAEVQQEPAVSFRPDIWRFQQDGGRRWLVRVHNLPRLSLFSPSRMNTLPVDEGDLTGRRLTKIRNAQTGSDSGEIEDDFHQSEDPNRSLQDRWTGETWLELKESSKQYPGAVKTRKVSSKPSTKRKAEADLETVTEEDVEAAEPAGEEVAAAEPAEGEVVLPQLPVISPLTTALRESGPDAVDGIRPMGKVTNACSHEMCVLPGGHTGPHEDAEGKQFRHSDQTGRVNVSDDDGSSSSTSSDSSDELIPDSPANEDMAQNLYVRKNVKALKSNAVPKNVKDTEVFFGDTPVYALEIPLEVEDVKWLQKYPERSAIWMSRKMMEKSKEKRWCQLSLEEKQQFDLAQAKELSNVLSSKALRGLSSQEMAELDQTQVASMRWVLTVKADGSPKARLVVLGFQMPGIEHLQTASPTMARVSRSLLLTVVANRGFRLRAGDVTAAFLQATEDLEHLQMTVWAPPELAILFGASPERPIMPLRISKAFYGLVQAPRCWFNDITSTLVKHGWRGVLADRCVYVLYDDEAAEQPEVIGIAGIHVDDLLLGGLEGHPKYDKARADLEKAYKWGKWQEGEIDYAGCKICQMSDGSVRIDQGDYAERWIDEIQLPKHRMQQVKSALTPSEVSMLRGAIGSMAWKSSQTAPHHQADVGLLLSELPFGTINTILKANKLIREMRREGKQSLLYPSWKRHWQDFAIVTWADAGQQNRPDHSSTLGVITGIAPQEFLDGERCQVGILNWRSSKTPRQCLGSNGAEVQAITEAEDITFRIRAMWTEIHGVTLTKPKLYELVKKYTKGALVMDTRGIYDAMSRNVSSLHGLRSSRAGYELTLAVRQALEIGTEFRWVNGLAQLGDCLTKYNQKKMFLQFLADSQFWRLIHDESFTAGKKLRKRELEKANAEMKEFFLGRLQELATANKWPSIFGDDPRSVGDESLADPHEHVTLQHDMESSPIDHLSS